jgi:hypothetical protein
MHMKKILFFLLNITTVLSAIAQCGTSINPPGAGKLLCLNGSTQSVTIPDNDDWAFGTGDFAIECWVKPTSTAAYTVVTQSVGNAATAGSSSFYMGVNNSSAGSFNFYSTTGTTWTNHMYTAANAVPAGVWSHIALVRISGVTNMYVNGINMATTGIVAANLLNGTQPLSIGAQNNAAFFNGGIDEVRVYKGAGLSQTEIRDWMTKKMTAAHPKWNSCVGYYRFDEATNNDVFDRKKCNNGNFVGTRIFADSDAPLGDVSAWNYAGNTSSAFVLFGDVTTDSLKATITSGTAAGIHIYGVADTPNNRNNLPWLIDNNRYGGVWVVNGNNAQYHVAYGYNNNPALANATANNFRLYKRISSTTLGWVETPNATNNTTTKEFTATGQSTEYIMGGPNVITPVALAPPLTKMEYFFDTDPGFGNGVEMGVVSGTNFTVTNFPLSLLGLEAGMHTLYIRSKNANETWSQSIPQTFYYEPGIINPVQNIVKAEYFFDTDPGFGNATDAGAVNTPTINLNLNPSLSGLNTGMHTFFMRTLDANNKWSQSIPQTFYYEPGISNPVQNIIKAEYFFDTDPGFGNATDAGAVNTPTINLNLTPSLSGLNAGMHTFFMRTLDANNKWSQSIPQTFYYEPGISNPVQNIIKAEYFFDTDPGFGNATDAGAVNTPTMNLILTPSLSGLNAGMHTFFMRTLDASNKWSQSIPQTFYYEPGIINPIQNIIKAEYFFDTDPGFGNATDAGTVNTPTINLNLNPSLSGLNTGMHTFFMRTLDANNKWSQSIPQTFYYEPAIINPVQNIVKAEYFFDTDPGFGNATNSSIIAGANINFSITSAINNLSIGLHNFFVRTQDATGKWSQSTPALFYYEPIINNPAPLITRAEYYIDNFVPVGKAIPVVFAPNDTVNAIQFPVNITGLNTGAHRLYLRTKTINGKWSLTSYTNFVITGTSAAPYILVNSFSPNTVCAGNSIDVAFHSTGSYAPNNIFTLQMSDGSGSFANPLVLGSINDTTVSSVITAVVPGGITAGINSYKLRVISSNTAVTGATSDSSLAVIGAANNLTDSTIYLNCYNDTYNLLQIYNISNGGVWNIPTPNAVEPGNYKYYLAAQGGACSDTAEINVQLEVALWTGVVSTNWHDAANWNILKVPTASTHVIIQNGTPNTCIISDANAVAASVQAKSAANFKIINNRNITIKGVCNLLPPS